MNDTMIAVGVILVVAAGIAVWLVRRRGQLRAQQKVRALLADYFNGDMSVEQLSRRSRDIASRRFLSSPEVQAIAWAAFQHAADAKSDALAHSGAEADRLMRALGELKKEFGLPDRYRNEGWRAGRE
jgi:hypothetical protein